LEVISGDHTVQYPWPKQSQLEQPPQGCISPVSDYMQGWRLSKISRSLCQVQPTLTVEKFLAVFKWNFLYTHKGRRLVPYHERDHMQVM